VKASVAIVTHNHERFTALAIERPAPARQPLSTETRARESPRMLRALGKHLGSPHKSTIQDIIARPFLDKALAAQVDGRRSDSARHVMACLRNGGWQLPGSQRTLAALAAYSLLGSRYKLSPSVNAACSRLPLISLQVNWSPI
jgi:hypothetical protein